MMAIGVLPGKRFELGETVISDKAWNSLKYSEMAEALKRHAEGDWGLVEPEQKARNDQSAVFGGEIRSCYRSKNGQLFWVVTEWDRSFTSIRMPSELEERSHTQFEERMIEHDCV